MKKSLAVCALIFTACPERSHPENGVVLVYEKGEEARDVRATVDRRLAALKVKATLNEDSKTLSIRIPNGEGVDRVKRTLSRQGRLEFCAEDEAVAKAWCELESASKLDGLCAVSAPTRAGVEALAADSRVGALAADAGVRLGVEPSADQFIGYAMESKCLQPRIVSTRAMDGALNLEFDRSSGQKFGELTGRLVGKRLIIWLDGEVKMAPRVQESITGGSAMLSLGAASQATPDDVEALGAALMGGALPPMSLRSESTYGPPSLFKK